MGIDGVPGDIVKLVGAHRIELVTDVMNNITNAGRILQYNI